MKQQLTRWMCLLLALLVLTGCGASAEPTTAPEESGAAVEIQPEAAPVEPQLDPMVELEQQLAEISALGTSPDDNYRVWYEIFVYSFCDSNGDGIGDLQGVISKLDYLQELGINGIWLMPIHPSTSYHKYNVADYYAIDPAYGTMEDMEQLLAQCDQRGIRVILDLVVNHTGYDHVWFQTAADYLRSLPAGQQPDPAACPYVEYYFFNQEGGSGYHTISGSDWYYEGQFSPDMPDLNLDSAAVRQEIQSIMQFWLDKGAAGFRLDAAKEFFTGQVSKNVEVLSWLQETAQAIRPDVYLVAEVWEGFNSVAQYYTSGITSLFNFPFANVEGKITQVLRAAGNAGTVATYASALEKADGAYRSSNPDYIDAPFLSNHDIGRIAGFVNRDASKTKLGGAMNIFMGGSCFIYYGEELGMIGSGNDPSKRAPMVWNEARDQGTTQPPPDCELPESYPFGSLELQAEDPTSIYNYYRQAIAIRKALPVISHGVPTVETALNMGCVSAHRKTWGEETCVILMNIDSQPAQVDLSAYADWNLAASLSADGGAVTLTGTSLDLPAFGVAILVPGT